MYMKKDNYPQNIYLTPAPKELENEFNDILTTDAINFILQLNIEFQEKIDDLYVTRNLKKYELAKDRRVPQFLKTEICDQNWKIAPIPKRLENRHLDLGDVSPTNFEHFSSALRANVQGIQVDFDDGHCPTWKNQILGLHNIYKVVHEKLPNISPISKLPILMFRPRAWNMLEHNMSINGREIPGAIFDFALLVYHNGHRLFQQQCGPFFYLSKLQASTEAKLWNEIFIWSEMKLGIPQGTIKACVLIEDILSAFEMEQILYELREHSIGLNCGIWDYSASIIAKFGNDSNFILPDRKKYVDMSKHFLQSYMKLVVNTCHKRNAHATGGMVAELLPDKNSEEFPKIIEKVCKTKLNEIQNGIDGFMVFDLGFVNYMNKLWKQQRNDTPNQITNFHKSEIITEIDLLTIPSGGVTLEGIFHNISVTILFIYNWLEGRGCFPYKGFIEDSATAEISRTQIWQWIRHAAKIENNNEIISRKLIHFYSSKLCENLLKEYGNTYNQKKKIILAFHLFLQIINHRELPEYITTYLNDAHVFRKFHAHL